MVVLWTALSLCLFNPPFKKLPARLLAAEKLLHPTKAINIADIGADHGLLSIHLVNKGKIVHAVEASGIAFKNGIGSLSLPNLKGKESALNVYLGDGLEPLVNHGIQIDSVMCIGIGIHTTSNILNDNHLSKIGASQIVVQCWPPNINPLVTMYDDLEMRGWIHENQEVTDHKRGLSISSSFIRQEKKKKKEEEDTRYGLQNWPLCRKTVLSNTENDLWVRYLKNQLLTIERCKSEFPGLYKEMVRQLEMRK
jgi:hypothetical protein